MGYCGDYGNSGPDWDQRPDDENKICVSDLKPEQKIELVRLKLLDEPDVRSITISYAWIKIDGINYRAVDLFGGDGMQWNPRTYRTDFYNWVKENVPKGVFINGLFDRMRWACS